MSSFGINEHGDAFKAADGKPGCAIFCSECGEAITYVREHHARVWGAKTFIPAHFRHRTGSNCAEAHGETAEHMAMKEAFKRAFPGAQEEVILASNRRADLVIVGRDGKRRSVECQHSPIEIKTVAGRIADHNACDLPIVWAFSPARLKNHALALPDGVTEALDASGNPDMPFWRTLRISSTGEASSSYAFYDMRFIDSPDIVNVEIELATHPLVDVKSAGRMVTVAAHDEDRLKYKLKRNYFKFLGEHTRFLDRAQRAKETAKDSDEPSIVWRRLMTEWGKDEAARFEIPTATPAAKIRDVFCKRAEEMERKEREEQQRKAREEHEKRMREIDLQRRKVDEERARRIEKEREAARVEEEARAARRKFFDQARNAIKYAEGITGAKNTFTNEETRRIRLTLRRYGEALQINLSDCRTIGEAKRRIVRDAHKITNRAVLE